MVIYAFKTRSKKDKKFAEGFCFYKLFLVYVIGCMIGTYYEEILTFCRSGEWLSRQGIIYGPFNPVYGAGFLAFSALLCRNLKRKWWLTYIYSCLIGEYVFQANAWDYSNKFLNILSRTTIPYMLFWGAGVLLSHVVSYGALFRYGTRSTGQPASSSLEVALDKYYDDSFMKQYYDNPVHEKNN